MLVTRDTTAHVYMVQLTDVKRSNAVVEFQNNCIAWFVWRRIKPFAKKFRLHVGRVLHNNRMNVAFCCAICKHRHNVADTCAPGYHGGGVYPCIVKDDNLHTVRRASFAEFDHSLHCSMFLGATWAIWPKRNNIYYLFMQYETTRQTLEWPPRQTVQQRTIQLGLRRHIWVCQSIRVVCRRRPWPVLTSTCSLAKGWAR